MTCVTRTRPAQVVHTFDGFGVHVVHEALLRQGEELGPQLGELLTQLCVSFEKTRDHRPRMTYLTIEKREFSESSRGDPRLHVVPGGSPLTTHQVLLWSETVKAA